MELKKAATDVFLGWSNLGLQYLNMIDPKLKEMGEDRMLICDSCTVRTDNTCDSSKTGKAIKDFTYINVTGEEKRIKGQEYKGCSCPLGPKTLSPKSQCPLSKW